MRDRISAASPDKSILDLRLLQSKIIKDEGDLQSASGFI